MHTIYDIPTEIQLQIFDYCTRADIYRLQRVNRSFIHPKVLINHQFDNVNDMVRSRNIPCINRILHYTQGDILISNINVVLYNIIKCDDLELFLHFFEQKMKFELFNERCISIAIENNSIKVISRLLVNNPKLPMVCYDFVGCAIQNNYVEMVKILIDAGYDLSKYKLYQITNLQTIDMIELLFEHNVRVMHYESIIISCIMFNKFDILKFIIPNYYVISNNNIPFLQISVGNISFGISKNTDIIKFLIQYSNGILYNDVTILYMAISDGLSEIVELLQNYISTELYNKTINIARHS